LAFAVSHPFARKKANGWGTELVQNQSVKDLVPKEELSFRRACQMDPIDSVLYSALIYEIGNAVEQRRRKVLEQSVFSYRFSPQADGTMYGKGNPWEDFWTTSATRAAGNFVAVLESPIGDP